jgi:NitT/TauT family transport system permease protein
MRPRRAAEITLTIAAPLLLLAIWELLSRGGVLNPIFWPRPSSLIDTFWRMVTKEGLMTDIRISLLRIIGGFVLGAVPAVVLGLAMGLFWPVRVFFMPLASAIYAIPKIAVLPLVIIAFGIGEASKLVIVAVSIFFLVALNTMSGVLEIDPTYRDAARNLGASRWELFYSVALPGALPQIFTGLRLGLGFALIVIVGAEFLAAKRGIGYQIWEDYQTLRIKQMFVGLVVTAMMGWGLTMLLSGLERLAMPWRRSA